MQRYLALFVVLFLAVPAFAQSALVGDWSGSIEVSPALSLTVIFHVSEGDDALVATLDSPDQGAFGLPLSDVVFADATFSATLAAASATYSGVLDGVANQIVGTWTQGGREMPLVLTPYEVSEVAANAEATKPVDIKPGDYSGDWSGTLDLGNGGEIRLTFHLAKNDEGAYNAILDAPGQAENLDIGQIALYGKDVTIDIMGQASYSGVIADDEMSMEGTFEQGGSKTPMTLTRQ